MNAYQRVNKKMARQLGARIITGIFFDLPFALPCQEGNFGK